MSANTLGIPLNFGMYYGFRNDNTVSLLTNCMPENCIFQFDKTNKLNNLEELNKYDTSKIITGHSIYLSDDNPDIKDLQTNQYMWDTNIQKWILLGNPTIQNVLNIYAVYPQEDNTLKAQYFMRLHLRNIQSNIRLLSLLNGTYSVSNLAIMSFLSLTGDYDLNNSQTNNILSNMLSINISYGIATLLKRLCLKYNVEYKDFTDFQNSIVTCTDKVIFESRTLFIEIAKKFYNIDISMYSNYIAAAYADFKNLLIGLYKDEIILPSINPLNVLSLNDSYLLTRLNGNKEMKLSFYEISEVLDYYLYQVNDVDEWNERYNFFIKLKEVIEYFFEQNNELKESTEKYNFFIDLCEGIGGIINLAILFSIISNSGNTSTTLYFHFICSKLYDQIY